MTQIDDHPLRYALVNELHARPFPALRAPCVAAYVAVKQPQEAQNRNRAEDMAHVLALLDRNGSGIVISAVHAGSVTSVFVKDVLRGGAGSLALTPEEQQAITHALR